MRRFLKEGDEILFGGYMLRGFVLEEVSSVLLWSLGYEWSWLKVVMIFLLPVRMREVS